MGAFFYSVGGPSFAQCLCLSLCVCVCLRVCVPPQQEQKQCRGPFSSWNRFLSQVFFFWMSSIGALVSRLSGGPTGPSQPDLPLSPEHVRPDLDWTQIVTRKGRFQVQIRSKSGPIQVCAEVFGGGRGKRGRSGWNGPVGPPESLDPCVCVAHWVFCRKSSCMKHCNHTCLLEMGFQASCPK